MPTQASALLVEVEVGQAPTAGPFLPSLATHRVPQEACKEKQELGVVFSNSTSAEYIGTSKRGVAGPLGRRSTATV